MAITHKRQDDLESMFANFAKVPEPKIATDPEDDKKKNRKKKEIKYLMGMLSNLPDSVLQWMAIFISIIIEALPFVLLGAILSGFIEVYVTPDLVQKFLPKNKFLRILF